MLTYLATGAIFGLSSGLAPGPLLTLVVVETLRHGPGAGVRVSLSPLVTDLPIIGISLFALSRLSGSHPLLGLISLAGSLFLVHLGFETFTSPPVSRGVPAGEARPLRRGIITNFLNPHPYLFWTTVGSPLLVRAWNGGGRRAAAFLAGFYLCLVGSKVVLAVFTGRGRHLLDGRAYGVCMRVLGMLLWGCALLLAVDGVRLLRA